MPKEDKFTQLKNCFFTNLTQNEIMEKLDISNYEYINLLKDVKKDLGLDSSYKRNPRVYGKYHKGAYMLVNPKENTILNFFPTKEIAENNLCDGCVVLKATDDELIKILEKEKELSFDELRRKYKLPYHLLLSLVKQMKNNLGISENQNRSANKFHHIYKYPPNGKLTIKKRVDGEMKSYGYYDDYDDALKVRDYLEKINWNHSLWFANRNNILKD